MRQGYLALLLGLLLSMPLFGQNSANFSIFEDSFYSRQKNVYDLGVYSQALSEEEILQLIREQRYQFSTNYRMEYKKHSYWLFIVDNHTSKNQEIFLNFNIHLPQTEAWVYRDGQLIPMREYPVAYDVRYGEVPPGRSFVIGKRLSGGTRVGRAVVMSIQDLDSMASEAKRSQLVMGGLFGAVAIMITYNLGMLLVFRRIYFLHYSLYSGASMFTLASLVGYLPWNIPLIGIGLGLSGTGLILFCDSALSLRTHEPRLYRFSLYLIAYCVGFSSYLWFDPQWSLVAFSIPFTLLFCLYVSIKRALGGYGPAIYLVIGWTAILVTATLAAFNAMFWGTMLLANIAIYGFALELCFFSFAIGLKVRLSEQRALRENQHAFNQLKKVFYPHQIDGIKSGVELERTMPTGKDIAAVINFDIIESSKIRQPYAKSFIENSIKSCVSIISENYDPRNMSANGYRVKEVGDGFLCSVGYPFQTPQNRSKAECAVALALRFIYVFQKQVAQLENHHPVYCSIGIAMDWVEGYYPKVGTIEYDVYGRGIILANRYESLRRQLFPQGVPGHIVTLSAAVYNGLPNELRSLFLEVDTQHAHLAVRDDLGATKLYYRLFKPEELRDELQRTG
jgi:hypothetical protein